MSAIESYLLDMLPYMVLALPLVVIGRVILVRWRKYRGVKSSFLHEVGFIILCLYLVGLASQTIFSELIIEDGKLTFDFRDVEEDRINLTPLHKIAETSYFIENGNNNYLLIEVFGNIGIFIPMGFILPLLWKRFEKLIPAVGTCLGLSILIEVTQLFLPRATDIDDVIMNTLGGLIGFILYKIGKKMASNSFSSYRKQEAR
ncbi:VanZ family protein [Caldibacillus lycopersici]|uniref:VanZ family protein n=1 Tax=Perspicuibacillus lycopersici TaxID=1325689 RepID=A0AAE3LRB3_9BACI|nr:VanZ family protein [Perspicuibacillus lycopersici]MCU9614439.1 VanZ family protein [Perspicuibacillus lycopersici]